MVTHGNRQFAAFYDENRALTVASRTLDSSTWKLVRLPTSVGWDSHNGIVMAIDGAGFIHVAGNMHSSPLMYFRTSVAFDIDTFERQTAMIGGTTEEKCTYPQFFKDKSGQLIFMYRSGESGNGNHIFNVYSTSTKTWRRLLDQPLTDGETLRNAYPVGPIQGPDDFWHLVWVWRESPDAASNHDLSYAKTADLVNWQTGKGTALKLPITFATSDVVDPVPVNQGMINNNTKIGFDALKRPVIAYHKFDQAGNTQLYNARLENGQWKSYVTSDWKYAWKFGGTGTLVFEIEVQPIQVQPDGTLTQSWYHAQYGGQGAFQLNPDTLRAEASIPPPVPYPASLAKVESTTADMQVRWQKDSGASPDPAVQYYLRWETLPSNRDQARTVIPPATQLRLYGF